MASMARKSAIDQGARPEPMSWPVIWSIAPPGAAMADQMIWAQARAAIAAIAASSTARSRRSSRSSRLSVILAPETLMDDAALGDVQPRELGVRIGQRDLQRPLRLGPAAADLGHVIFEPVRQVDPRPMLLAGHRVADRLAAGLDHAWNDQLRDPPVHVHLEPDRREDRLVDRLVGGREDLEEGRARHRILAAHDPQQRLALLRAGALVDDRNDLAAAFVDGAGPR